MAHARSIRRKIWPLTTAPATPKLNSSKNMRDTIELSVKEYMRILKK